MVRAQCGESAARRAKEKAHANRRCPRGGAAASTRSPSGRRRIPRGTAIHGRFTLGALSGCSARPMLPPSVHIIIIQKIVRILPS